MGSQHTAKRGQTRTPPPPQSDHIVTHDVTESKKVERETKERQRYLEGVLAAVPDAIVALDAEHKVVEWNPGAERLFGYSAKEAIGQDLDDLITNPDVFQEAVELTKMVLSGKQVGPVETVRYHKDGSPVNVILAGSPIFIGDELIGVTAVYTDTTERKRAEEMLRRRNRELALLNRASRALSSTLDLDQVLTILLEEVRYLMNVVACSVWLIVPDTNELVCQQTVGPRVDLVRGWRLAPGEGIAGWTARTGRSLIVPDTQTDERHFKGVDQTTGVAMRSILSVPLQVKQRVIGVLQVTDTEVNRFSATDLDLMEPLAAAAAIAIENARLFEAEREQRKLVERSQAQLVRSEKLAATGRLAASLAHEINNPLQAIHNGLQLILNFPLEPDEQREYLQLAAEEVERLIDMVTRILEFARPPQQARQPTDVGDIIEKVLALTSKYLQHRNIVLRQDRAPNLPRVMIAPDELGQVFLNLVLNAVDAMPGGGILSISSRLAEDGRLAIALSDTGVGIPPEHLDRIFEPFFSTKEGGTGLGLTVCHNVVKRYGGEITVQSVYGKGTTFTVWLPALSE